MNHNKGFTLIEVTVSLAILSILLLLVGNLTNYNFREYGKSYNNYEYKTICRYTMSKITNIVKQDYGAIYSSGKILANDLSTVINSNKNDNTGMINYYYEPNKYAENDGYGELRDQTGQTIAKYIKDFSIESINDNVVKVTIKVGKENNSKMFEQSSYIRLYD